MRRLSVFPACCAPPLPLFLFFFIIAHTFYFASVNPLPVPAFPSHFSVFLYNFHPLPLAFSVCERYTVSTKKEAFQGRVQFPTGGTVREPHNFCVLNRCNSDTDSDSLDGRRGEMQGEVYPPADSVTALGCHTHSGAFCLRKSFACHFHTLNPWFRVFFWR